MMREEVDLSTALVKNPAYEIGDIYEEDVTPKTLVVWAHRLLNKQ